MGSIEIPVCQDGEITIQSLNIDSFVKSTIEDRLLRYESLRKREWQRWTPLLGVYRLIKDDIAGDWRGLRAVHSGGYETAVTVYNLLQIAVGANSLPQIIDKLM